MNHGARLGTARRLVVKVGSSLLIGGEGEGARTLLAGRSGRRTLPLSARAAPR